MQYIKCKDCPLKDYHFLLRAVDETIIGCTYPLIIKANGNVKDITMVHKVKTDKHKAVG